MNIKLNGKTDKSSQILTAHNIVPEITGLEGKMITSFQLNVEAGEIATATVKFREMESLQEEKVLELRLTSLNLDCDVVVFSSEVKWLEEASKKMEEAIKRRDV